MSKLRDSNAQLSHGYINQQKEIDRCHDQIARQASANHNLQLQLESYQTELEDALAELADYKNKEDEKAENGRTSIEYEIKDSFNNQELNKLRMQLQFKEESIQTLKSANEQYRDKNSFLEMEFNLKVEQLNQFTLEMQKKDEEIEWFYLQKEGRAPSTFRLEIDQLREDNKRLIGMLKHTKEFKQFGGYVEDSGGDVRILEKGQERRDEPQNN